MTSLGSDAEAFRRFYAAHYPALLVYAIRRVGQPEEAADVVAESFLVAWRRGRDLPAGDEARLWMYGVARNVLANQQRGSRRRERLGERLRQRLAGEHSPDHSGEVTERLVVQAALAKLNQVDREVLTLTVWEQLEPREIAEVLHVSAAAVRTRLSRARARLRDLIGDEFVAAGHVRGVRQTLATEEQP